MSKRKKTNLRIVKEIYGDRKIEEVFEELYEKIYGLKVKVRRKTSAQKYDQDYKILLLPYTELHPNSKQDLLQLLKSKTIVYFTYTDSDQQQDFMPDVGNRIFSFMSHMLKGAQQNKRAIPVRFILMDIEAIGFIPKLPKFMAGCRGFNVGTCLFIDDKETLLYGYNKAQVEKIYSNSTVVAKELT